MFYSYVYTWLCTQEEGLERRGGGGGSKASLATAPGNRLGNFCGSVACHVPGALDFFSQKHGKEAAKSRLGQVRQPVQRDLVRARNVRRPDFDRHSPLPGDSGTEQHKQNK